MPLERAAGNWGVLGLAGAKASARSGRDVPSTRYRRLTQGASLFGRNGLPGVIPSSRGGGCG